MEDKPLSDFRGRFFYASSAQIGLSSIKAPFVSEGFLMSTDSVFPEIGISPPAVMEGGLDIYRLSAILTPRLISYLPLLTLTHFPKAKLA